MIRKLLLILPFLAALAFGQTVPKNVTKAGGTNIITEDLVFDSRILTLNTSIVFGDGVRQTFNPNGTAAGLNVGSHTADPSSLVNGDIWYNSTSNEIKVRANGATTALGAGGGSGDVVGPAASIDARLALFDSTTGKLLKQSTAVTESGGTLTSNTLIGLTAGGTNQNVVLTPSGTGINVLTGGWRVGTASATAATGNALLYGSDNATATLSIRRGDGTNGGAQLFMSKARTSLASPTAVLSADRLSAIAAGGYNGAAWVETTGLFGFSATENWNSGAMGTSFVLGLTPNGSTTRSDILTIDGTGAFTFADGVRQTFNPNGTNAGLNVGSHTSDPSSPSNGDLWYDSTANELTARINGSNVALGAGGGGGSVATDTIWDAKGDLAVGTGANTAAKLVATTNGYVLTLDSAEATGMKWVAPGTGSLTLARFTALDNQPPASAYAQFRTRNSIAVLDFDAATDESAVFVNTIPQGADFTTGIAVRIYWIATSATTNDVVWNSAFERGTTDLDADSFATAVAGTSTTNATSGIVTVTTINHSGAEIDSLAAGDLFRLKITRDADNGSDTMTGDAEIVAIELRQR